MKCYKNNIMHTELNPLNLFFFYFVCFYSKYKTSLLRQERMARTTLNMERDNSDSLKPHFKCFKYAMINFFIFCRGVKKIFPFIFLIVLPSLIVFDVRHSWKHTAKL